MESENRSQTESPADQSHPDDSACIPTGPTESDSHSAPLMVLNADKQELQPLVTDATDTSSGDIDEVNGLGGNRSAVCTHPARTAHSCEALVRCLVFTRSIVR